MEYIIRCSKCGNIEDAPSAFRCSRCDSVLEVQYTSMPKPVKTLKGALNKKRYLRFLPINSYGISLGEGNTPLIQKKFDEYPDVKILFKIETKNPTGSFKDRGSAVEITKALEFGFKKVVCASTGNMGMSVAHYAKEAGLNAKIFISKDGNKNKMGRIAEYGAEIEEVNGDFNDAMLLAETEAKKTGAFVCGDYHFRKEGQKTLMFEVIDQLKGAPLSDMFVPVGNSTLLAATYKALNDFFSIGLINSMPKLHGVQAEGCNPLVTAYVNEGPIKRITPNTIADAIAVGYPTFGYEGLDGIRATFGDADQVSDEDIKQAMKKLKEVDIGAEPGGAAAFAGFIKNYKDSPWEFSEKTVVIPVTGNND